MQKNMDEIYTKCHDICYTIDNLNSRKQKAVNAILKFGGLPKDDTDELIKRIEAFYNVMVRDLKEGFFNAYEELYTKGNNILVFADNDLDISRPLKREDVEEALKVCENGPCGHRHCPLHGIPDCTTILRMYKKGEYSRTVSIKEV